MSDRSSIRESVQQAIVDVVAAGQLKPGQLFVIGCSTSEVLGQKIGTSGTLEIAEQIYDGVQAAASQTGIVPVFQCCEHLNRALVMPRSAAEQRGYEPVSVIPVARAGGSMATFAYHAMGDEAVLVEDVSAHGGIDIGDTMIGMHLRKVAVPVRIRVKHIGEARLTAAFTRPKLIGGARAVYTKEVQE